MVDRSSGPGAECLVSDPGFATSAVGKSGNLFEPQFPCLQSRDAVPSSCMGMLGGANMTVERIPQAHRRYPGSITAPAEGPQEPGVVTITPRQSQL